MSNATTYLEPGQRIPEYSTSPTQQGQPWANDAWKGAPMTHSMGTMTMPIPQMQVQQFQPQLPALDPMSIFNMMLLKMGYGRPWSINY